MLSEDDHEGEYRVSPWVWMTYLVLLAVGIPWYWPEGVVVLWFGLPAWLVTAVAASTAASVLTAVVLRRPWPGEEESPRGEDAP